MLAQISAITDILIIIFFSILITDDFAYILNNLKCILMTTWAICYPNNCCIKILFSIFTGHNFKTLRAKYKS